MCKSRCVSVALAMLLVAACGPTGAASPPTPPAAGAQPEITLGQEFALRVGQTAALGGGAGIRLTFEAVREDSRCPVGVTCIWAGDAVVAVTVDDTGGGGTRTLVEFHTNPSVDAEAVFGGYTLRLVGLSPVPREGSTIEVDEYQATLVMKAPAG